MKRSVLIFYIAALLLNAPALRTTADTLERRVSDDRWPLPKYREMLFVY